MSVHVGHLLSVREYMAHRGQQLITGSRRSWRTKIRQLAFLCSSVVFILTLPVAQLGWLALELDAVALRSMPLRELMIACCSAGEMGEVF